MKRGGYIMNRAENFKKASISFIVLGYILLISTFFLPADFLAGSLGGLRIAGLITVFVCPAFGVLGLIFTYLAYQFRNIFLLLANIVLLFSFPIAWFVASLFAIR